MAKLILVRHGQSEWNKQNLFTGWVDIPLSRRGIEEATKAGQCIKNIPIDIIFTSTLVRAQMTVFLAMLEHDSGKIPVVLHQGEGKLETWGKIFSEQAKEGLIPVIRAWELNERMYGELQGLNKAETAAKFGAEQVQIWRRSYDIAPPEGESLAMTAKRSIPYFKQTILPILQQDQNIFISAHGNSLRSIMMDIEDLNEDQVVHLELETGVPIIYNFDGRAFVKEQLTH